MSDFSLQKLSKKVKNRTDIIIIIKIYPHKVTK